MKIILKRTGKAVRFEGVNEQGNKIHAEGSLDIGGKGESARPMELLLMSLASCSAIDIVSMLKKVRQNLEGFEIEATGERDRERVPAVFKTIHLHYILSGSLKESKVGKVVAMSLEKYCSVYQMLKHSCKITYSFTIK